MSARPAHLLPAGELFQRPRRQDLSDRPRGGPPAQVLPTRASAQITDVHADKPHPLSPRTRTERQTEITHPDPSAAVASGVVGAGLLRQGRLPSRSSGIEEGPGIEVRHVPQRKVDAALTRLTLRPPSRIQITYLRNRCPSHVHAGHHAVCEPSLTLVHPAHPDAPTARYLAPARLHIPRAQQRPMAIQLPTPSRANARASRLASAMTTHDPSWSPVERERPPTLRSWRPAVPPTS